MIDDKRVIAVIPARSGSKGLSGKNIRNLLNKPLIAWTIEAAQASKYVDYVLVSTDSEEIAQVARNFGAETPFIRPRELALDETPSVDVILHALDYCEKNLGQTFEFIVLLEPTSPLRDGSDIDRAFLELHSNGIATSIVGIARTESQNPAFLVTREESGTLKNLARQSMQPSRRQEIEEVFFLEGSIYLTSCKELRKNNSFYHSKTIGCLFPKWKSFEIDDLTDFVIVEALISRKGELNELS